MQSKVAHMMLKTGNENCRHCPRRWMLYVLNKIISGKDWKRAMQMKPPTHHLVLLHNFLIVQLRV
jgi:hypothetical protein